MYNIWFQPLKYLEKIEINTEIFPLALVKRYDFHVFSGNPPTKIGVALKTYDGMPITLGRNMIDQVYKTVFQAANTEMVNYMYDKRRRLLLSVDFSGLSWLLALPCILKPLSYRWHHVAEKTLKYWNRFLRCFFITRSDDNLRPVVAPAAGVFPGQNKFRQIRVGRFLFTKPIPSPYQQLC